MKDSVIQNILNESFLIEQMIVTDVVTGKSYFLKC